MVETYYGDTKKGITASAETKCVKVLLELHGGAPRQTSSSTGSDGGERHEVKGFGGGETEGR